MARAQECSMVHLRRPRMLPPKVMGAAVRLEQRAEEENESKKNRCETKYSAVKLYEVTLSFFTKNIVKYKYFNSYRLILRYTVVTVL